MAVIFCDGFDMYSSLTDMVLWSNTSGDSLTNVTPPFGNGQTLRLTTTASTATFTSATNETTVYGSIRVFIVSGSSAQYTAFTLTDAGTAQCTIRFNCDGSIGLYTGGPTGTLLQTYTGLYTPSTWHGFQFKIVISNTVGSIEIRQDGVTSNTITKTGVNTRGGTTNAFVNGFSVINTSIVANGIDDVFLNNTSGNQPTSWPGDVRAIQQTPTASTQKNFDVVTPTLYQPGQLISANAVNISAGTAVYLPFTLNAKYTSIIGIRVSIFASITGNVRVAVFDNSAAGSKPGVALGSVSINNPQAQAYDLIFSSPITITGGATYYAAIDQDISTNYRGAGTQNAYNSATAYASFPTNNPSVSLTAVQNFFFQVIVGADTSDGILELIQDGDTTYVYTSTVEEDKYSMSPIGTGYSVVAMQYYAMYKRSDVGARTMQLSVAANGSADTALFTDAAIPQTYAYKFKTIENDPTGAAWTPSHVNGAIVGLAVTV